MSLLRPWLVVVVALLPAVACAAEIAIASLVEGSPRLLRGATWYRLVPGARLEVGDIISAADRAQMLAEFANGSILSLVGPGALYLEAKPVKATAADSPAFTLVNGWLKVVARAPGVRLHTPSAELTTADGVLVMHGLGPTLEVFVESGTARIAALLPNGNAGPAQDAKQGEHWSNISNGRFATAARAPKAFVESMPRHFLDPLPSLAAKYKTGPTLAADGDVTYAEAEPWLASRDRAAFEKRFAVRLRDPVFRRAVEPQVARYPSWDRMLHPEKYAPKPTPVQ